MTSLMLVVQPRNLFSGRVMTRLLVLIRQPRASFVLDIAASAFSFVKENRSSCGMGLCGDI